MPFAYGVKHSGSVINVPGGSSIVSGNPPKVVHTMSQLEVEVAAIRIIYAGHAILWKDDNRLLTS